MPPGEAPCLLPGGSWCCWAVGASGAGLGDGMKTAKGKRWGCPGALSPFCSEERREVSAVLLAAVFSPARPDQCLVKCHHRRWSSPLTGACGVPVDFPIKGIVQAGVETSDAALSALSASWMETERPQPCFMPLPAIFPCSPLKRWEVLGPTLCLRFGARWPSSGPVRDGRAHLGGETSAAVSSSGTRLGF